MHTAEYSYHINIESLSVCSPPGPGYRRILSLRDSVEMISAFFQIQLNGKNAKKKESKEKKTQITEMKKKKEKERRKGKKSLFFVASGIRTNNSHGWQFSKISALLTSRTP